jgi:hypothetical protein
MKKLLFLGSFLLLSSSAAAGEVFIPAVYRGGGALGTAWRTEIVVASISDLNAPPVQATITLHRDDGQTAEVRMPLTPFEVIAIPDALRDWFGVEAGGGIVRVTWPDQAGVRLSARARIYNLGENGQYGQAVPGIEPQKLGSTHYLTGLTGVDGNRTNVGVSNPFTGDAMIFVSLRDTSGSERGGFATIIPGRSYRQFNDIFSNFSTGPLNAAMVVVTGFNMPVFAYASIVRNDTGDATFVASP